MAKSVTLTKTRRHRPSVVLHANTRLFRNLKRHDRKQLPEEYSKWISDMISLCFDISSQTSAAILEWENFKEECLQFFMKESYFPLKSSIAQTFNHIRELEHLLQALIKELEQDQNTVRTLCNIV